MTRAERRSAVTEDAGRSRIFNEIRDMLLNEGFSIGDPLPTEAQLMERLSCSRSSLREALKQLQTLGLVEIRRGVGTYVGPLGVGPLFDAIAVGTVLRSRVNPGAFKELLETRVALDVGMADAICAKFKGKRDAELEDIVTRMIELAGQDSGFLEEDKAFHQKMQGAVGNGFALDLVMNFWDVFGKLQLDQRIGKQVHPKDVADAHRELLDAAYAGDPDRYRDAVEWHYEGSRRQADVFAELGDGAAARTWLRVPAGWS